ncbi:MAG: hypothetical protein AB7G93_13385 [Bdellovibrionales bacterium]
MSSPRLLDLGANGQSSLDRYKVIDLSANVEVGTSCGEMDVSANLRANLNDLLSDDFFKGMGNKIQGAGGMLALCYLSPSYCAIAKHMRLSSHFLSQLNLDSCGMIDKYIDTRVSDYEMSKQQCVRSTMERNGNNVKGAIERCGDSGRNLDLSDWSGGSKGPVRANALIESTAKWAGLKGDDAARVIEVTKAFVGDTVVASGGVEVEFGARKKLTTPREFINEEGKASEERINDLIAEIDRNDGSWHLNRTMQDKVAETFKGEMSPEVGYETLRKLSFMPTAQRGQAVRKLSRALASHRVVEDAEKSLELLSLAARNPNLPPLRQQEAISLREQLKDQLELTLAMRKGERNELADVLGSIHSEGDQFESGVSRRKLEGEASKHNQERLKDFFMDCSDAVFCGNGGT